MTNFLKEFRDNRPKKFFAERILEPSSPMSTDKRSIVKSELCYRRTECRNPVLLKPARLSSGNSKNHRQDLNDIGGITQKR